jgi:hypothetical protein
MVLESHSDAHLLEDKDISVQNDSDIHDDTDKATGTYFAQ